MRLEAAEKKSDLIYLLSMEKGCKLEGIWVGLLEGRKGRKEEGQKKPSILLRERGEAYQDGRYTMQYQKSGKEKEEKPNRTGRGGNRKRELSSYRFVKKRKGMSPQKRREGELFWLRSKEGGKGFLV